MKENELGSPGQMKVWIDLDNTPHVPFFAPIIQELENRGYRLLITARDCFQVCDLADLLKLKYKRVGHHYGKNKIRKFAGLCIRALQMAPTILSEKPDLALSHTSRSQLALSAVLGIPSLSIGDYEFSRGWVFLHPSWVMTPDVIPDAVINCDKDHVLKYPGIKEDVYVPSFKPDPGIKAQLGLDGEHLVVIVRPPADEAHYHNPQSDELFDAVIDFLSEQPNVKMVVLPRNERQGISIRRSRPSLWATGKICIPDHVVDGLNLIWYSDLVISGGGTMNREAAALGVPVYSIFRGKIGAVDRYLVSKGRLTLIESVEDVRSKIILVRRPRPAYPATAKGATLRTVVDNIVAVLESACQKQPRRIL